MFSCSAGPQAPLARRTISASLLFFVLVLLPWKNRQVIRHVHVIVIV